MKKLLWVFILSSTSVCLPLHSNEDMKFAEKLEKSGFKSLAVKHYEKGLEGSELDSGKKDEIHLKVYQILRIRAQNSQGKISESFLVQAAKHKSLIENRDSDSFKIEMLQTDLAALRDAVNKVKSTKLSAEEILRIKKEGKKAFERISPVTDKIREETIKKLDEFEYLEDEEMKKRMAEYKKVNDLNLKANMKFGEACVLYANLYGRNDPDVRSWLIRMAESYENFVMRRSEDPASILGNMYLGEVNILLGKYTNKNGGEIDGSEDAMDNFNEAHAFLRAIPKVHKVWVEATQMNAYSKQISSLTLVGERELAVKAIDKLLKWKDPVKSKIVLGADGKPDTANPKTKLHYQLMEKLQAKAKFLIALVEEHVADRDSSDIEKKENYEELLKNAYDAVNLGKSICSRLKSPWQNNFSLLVGKLPPPSEGMDLTADMAFLRGETMYREANNMQLLSTEPGELTQETLDLYFESSSYYATCLSKMSKWRPSKKENLEPKCFSKLCEVYYRMGNYLLSLSVAMKALETYPSTKYSEKEFPQVYKDISLCVKRAKWSPKRRYMLYGKQKFDKKLYLEALEGINRFFPEEAESNDYSIASLLKSSGEYSNAISYFEKVDKKNTLYTMSQFHIADCQYKKIREKELRIKENQPDKEVDATAESYRKPREETIERFRFVVKMASKEPEEAIVEEMDENRLRIYKANLEKARSSSLNKIYLLYGRMGERGKARDVKWEAYNLTADEGKKRSTLNSIINDDYRMDDLESLEKDIIAIAKFAVGPDTWSREERAENLNNYYKMQANLLTKLNIKPLAKKLEEALVEGNKDKVAQVQEKLAEGYLQIAGAFEKSLEVTGEKNPETLARVVSLYYAYDKTPQRAMNNLEKYFSWSPGKPLLDTWYQENLGKSIVDWDKKIGPFNDPERKDQKINHPSVRNKYLDFLDALFDEVDFSKMSIKEIREWKKERKADKTKRMDKPRNYYAALKIYKELLEIKDRDSNFRKIVLPQLKENIIPKIEKGVHYYDFRYKLALCYSRFNSYAKAADVFDELAKYYVEFFNIRIEMAKCEAAKKTEEGFAKAKKVYVELIDLISSPIHPNYNPLDYYRLWLQLTRLHIEKEGVKPAEVVRWWRKFRTKVYQDRRYWRVETKRFKELKITGEASGVHRRFIQESKDWMEKNIFPILRESDDELKNDNWDAVLNIKGAK